MKMVSVWMIFIRIISELRLFLIISRRLKINARNCNIFVGSVEALRYEFLKFRIWEILNFQPFLLSSFNYFSIGT